MDCSPPGSSVHQISPARILEWVASSFPWGYSWPRDWTNVPCISCTIRRILYHRTTWEASLWSESTKEKWEKNRTSWAVRMAWTNIRICKRNQQVQLNEAKERNSPCGEKGDRAGRNSNKDIFWVTVTLSSSQSILSLPLHQKLTCTLHTCRHTVHHLGSNCVLFVFLGNPRLHHSRPFPCPGWGKKKKNPLFPSCLVA